MISARKLAPADALTQMTMPKKWPALLAGGATLLGLALRVNDLGRIGLGSDEGHSAWMAAQPLGDLARLLAADSAPPLYYVVLSLWQGWFPTDVGLRALSVLLGTAAIPILYLIGRRMAGEAAGVAAAFFMAVSNFQIEYSQMVKSYALFFLLTQVALLALLRATEDPRRKGAWAVLGLAMAGVMYTHSVGPFMAAGVGLFGALRLGGRLREQWKPFAGAHLLAALIFLPWLGVAIPQARAVVTQFWAPTPRWHTPAKTFEAFLVKAPNVPDGITPLIPEERPGITGLPFMEGRIGDRPQRLWLAVPAAAFLVCILLACLEPQRWSHLALFAIPLVPMAALFLISVTVGSIYLHRTLLPGLVVVPLLLSIPFAPLRAAPAGLRRAAKAAASAAFVVMLLTGWHHAEVRELPSWREAAAHLNARSRPGEAIVYDGHFGQIILERYLEGPARELAAFGLPSDWQDGETPTMGKWVTGDEDLAPLREAARAHGALWLVRAHTRSHDPEDLGRKWCRDHLHETERLELAFIEVYRFEGPAKEGM